MSFPCAEHRYSFARNKMLHSGDFLSPILTFPGMGFAAHRRRSLSVNPRWLNRRQHVCNVVRPLVEWPGGPVAEDALKRVVSRIANLPTLPHAVASVVSLTSSPNCTVAAVAKVIARDPTLSMKVLKLVNSAFYGFSGRIANLSQAIVILGLNTVRNVTLSASVFNVFQKNTTGGASFDRSAELIHANSSAFIARYLAGELGGHDPEEAFVGGLLHDIGKIVLDTYLPGEFAQAMALSKSSNLDSSEAEQQVLGATHAEVGGWLVERWKLPGHLGEALAHHHRPDPSSKSARLAALLCLADCMDHLQAGPETEVGRSQLPAPALEIIPFGDDLLPKILADTRDETEKAKAFFAIVSDSPETSRATV